MARVKYISVKNPFFDLSIYPNFSASGSVKGMKKQYYGKDALLVRSGNYIYKVPEHIYNHPCAK